jgi:hypothetical protein
MDECRKFCARWKKPAQRATHVCFRLDEPSSTDKFRQTEVDKRSLRAGEEGQKVAAEGPKLPLRGDESTLKLVQELTAGMGVCVPFAELSLQQVNCSVWLLGLSYQGNTDQEAGARNRAGGCSCVLTWLSPCVCTSWGLCPDFLFL